MKRHAADLRKQPQKRAEPPGLWMTAPRLILWTLMTIIVTSAGWAAGLYLF
jgi:hypothetical protein